MEVPNRKRKADNEKKPKVDPNIAVIQPPFQRLAKLDLFSR